MFAIETNTESPEAQGNGFSNNARSMFGQAPYHKAVMRVDGDIETTIELH